MIRIDSQHKESHKIVEFGPVGLPLQTMKSTAAWTSVEQAPRRRVPRRRAPLSLSPPLSSPARLFVLLWPQSSPDSLPRALALHGRNPDIDQVISSTHFFGPPPIPATMEPAPLHPQASSRSPLWPRLHPSNAAAPLQGRAATCSAPSCPAYLLHGRCRMGPPSSIALWTPSSATNWARRPDSLFFTGVPGATQMTALRAPRNG
jgi:hypothetical protein